MERLKLSPVVLFLCLAWVCIPASAAPVSFAAPSYISTDYCHACMISTGDLNGDGKLDMVLAGSQVVILLGNGDGTFQPPVTIDIDDWPSAYPNQGRLALGDFNHDGKLDLLTLTPDSGGGYKITVLLGDGHAAFQPPISTSAAISTDDTMWLPPLLTTGDFNNDGNLDVAIADLIGVRVFWGNGNGTFQTPAYLIPILNAPWGLAAADFNSDGKLDIFAGMYVVLNNGNGTFTLPMLVTDATDVSAFNWGWLQGPSVVADFNGDGNPDVAVWRYDGGSPIADVTSVFGNGDGTFQPLAPQLGVPMSMTWPILGEGDFDLDGKHEVVTSHATAGDILIGSVVSGGTLGLVNSFRLLADSPHQIVVGDFNRDNSPDLAISFINENLGPSEGPRVHEGIAMFLNMRGTYVNGTATKRSNCMQPVTFTATVAGSLNQADFPTGTVAFVEGKTVLGTANLSGGQVRVKVHNLGAGAHQVTAFYLGDSNFNPSWSSAIPVMSRKDDKLNCPK